MYRRIAGSRNGKEIKKRNCIMILHVAEGNREKKRQA